MTYICLFGIGVPAWSSNYTTAAVTISGVQPGSPVSGTMTIAFNGYSETVSYGQFSTASSIAAGFAALFAQSQAACTGTLLAKATGSTITFQLNGGASFGPITITSTPTTGTNPFGASVPTPSNTFLVSSVNPSAFGTSVTFTATVPKGATGSVVFVDGTTSLGSATISGGFASLTSASLAVGNHTVTAIYSGDGTYSGSVSGAVTQVVNQATPTVTLATSGTPSTHGASVTFTATVSSALAIAPTGTVTFYDGSTVIGTAQVSGATATMTTSALASGAHIITANYAGDTNFAAATSSAIDQVVTTPVPNIITTVAGNGTCGYLGNNGPATSAELCDPTRVSVDASGNIYIADTSNNRIRKVDTTGTITTVAGNGTFGYTGDGGAGISASLSYPEGVSVDASGNIYIADAYNNCIRKVDTTGTITTVAGNGTSGWVGDGHAATSAELNRPTDVDVDASGNIYIADSLNSRIRKVDTTGTITTVAGNGTFGYINDGVAATSTALSEPESVSVDASGNIYIADTNNNRIRKVDVTGTITTVAGDGTFGYISDGVAATSTALSEPEGVSVDASGNIYIADTYNNRIRKVDATGTITTAAGDGINGYSGDGGAPTSAELSLPFDAYVDASGNIYITDSNNSRIRAVKPADDTLTLATSGSPSVYGSPVTFTATVPSGDTNTVTFYSAGSPLGTATPSNGIASLTVSNLASGVNPITAIIAAGGSYPAEASNLIDQVVNPLTATISISNIPSNAGYGGSFIATYSYSGNGSPSVSSSTPSVCAALDSTVYYFSAGTCTLQASVPATAGYTAAIGSPQSFTVSPPTIDSLSPTFGSESTPVTISGTGFGSSPATTTVAFNGTVANISSWSNTSIVTAVPIGATTGNVVVTTNGTASNGVPFTIQATTPTIVSLSASSGNAGLAVSISGSGFGATEGQSKVTFNGVTAGVLNWSDSSITAIVPSSATTGSVVVTLSNNQMSNTNITFTIANSTSCN